MRNTSLIFVLLPFFLLQCKGGEEVGEPEETRPVVAKATGPMRLPYYNDSTFTPRWLKGSPEELSDFHKIPPFQLTNQDGIEVSEVTFKDKIYVADFFFTTCPGICLTMTQSMSQLQKRFNTDEDVLFLSHSVTPTKDTPEVLNAYAQSHGAISGKWHMVTGDRKTIYTLGRKHYFAEEDLGKEKSEDDFLHTENFLLIDSNRHIRGIYNGLNQTDMRQLASDIELLKKE